MSFWPFSICCSDSVVAPDSTYITHHAPATQDSFQTSHPTQEPAVYRQPKVLPNQEQSKVDQIHQSNVNQEPEPQESQISESNPEEALQFILPFRIETHTNVTRIIAINTENNEIAMVQLTQVQHRLVIGERSENSESADVISEPSTPLAIEPGEIKEMLSFNAILCAGTALEVIMELDNTLNDLVEYLNNKRGYCLRSISVDGNRYNVNSHGRFALSDLGIGNQTKVICNPQ